VITIVAYDISDDLRRAQAAARLLRIGVRVQRSVFECESDQDQIAAVTDEIAGLIDLNRDVLHLFPQCPTCRGNTVRIGQARPPLDARYWVV